MNSPVYVAGFERGVRPIGDWSMTHDLVDVLDALDGVVRARPLARAVQLVRERASRGSR